MGSGAANRQNRIFMSETLQSPAASSSPTTASPANIDGQLAPAEPEAKGLISYWKNPAVISRNSFEFKSLSSWSFNIAVGCNHGCRFCYVPDASTRKQEPILREYGVTDADEQWGQYVLLRPWDGPKFNASLRSAEGTPLDKLNADGNRAVMFCSTTDPYQTAKLNGIKETKKWNLQRQRLVHYALRRIRDYSTLNVRILTRSPLSKEDFELFKTFGDRLVFGMSLPTLDNDLARIYEPNAPAPSQRLKTLQNAKESGLNVFVAIAPSYPECDEADIRATLRAVKALGPVTIFHEPINIRANNVQRIEEHAKALGRTLKTEVFATKESWRRYAIGQLVLVQKLAEEEGVADRLHLWPDKDLKSPEQFKEMRKAEREEALGRPMTAAESKTFKVAVDAEFALFKHWIEAWHNRVSEWPGNQRSDWQYPQIPEFLIPKQDSSS